MGLDLLQIMPEPDALQCLDGLMAVFWLMKQRIDRSHCRMELAMTTEALKVVRPPVIRCQKQFKSLEPQVRLCTAHARTQ